MRARVARTEPARAVSAHAGDDPSHKIIRAPRRGTYIARTTQQKSPPNHGGWHIFVTGIYSVEFANPARRNFRADGNQAINGWAPSAQVEAEVRAWYDAKSVDEEKTIARRLNKAALDHVLYAPLGVLLSYHAWRKNVSGIVQAPLPLFWGVSKSA